MHELSIAQYLIEAASDAAAAEGAQRVTRLVTRIGAMSGVVKEALRFSFDLAAEGTACEGAVLEIEDVPVTVECPHCERQQTPADCWTLICPVCGTATPKLLTGRELDLISVEVW